MVQIQLPEQEKQVVEEERRAGVEAGQVGEDPLLPTTVHHSINKRQRQQATSKRSEFKYSQPSFSSEISILLTALELVSRDFSIFSIFRMKSSLETNRDTSCSDCFPTVSSIVLPIRSGIHILVSVVYLELHRASSFLLDI